MAEISVHKDTSARLEALLAMRRDDGAFPYRANGPGLAECTCYALLACKAAGLDSPGDSARSLDWLMTLAREDGGFAPQVAVGPSNWVTSLVSITMGVYGRAEAQRKTVEWLLGLSGSESKWLHRTVQSLMGVKLPYPQTHQGWPWVEGTAAWLSPTVLGTLAMMQAGKSDALASLWPRAEQRREDACKMLIDRRCADGGWNYGSPRALGNNASSYPETTGMAILALQGTPRQSVSGAIGLAQKMLAARPHSSALSWLQLGLSACGEQIEPGEETTIQCRSTLDCAMRVLALQAMNGHNVFQA